jgi:transposase
MIGDTRRETVLPIIKRKVAPDSVVYSDTYAVYDTLSVEGYRHWRVNHDERFAEEGRNHINGIENFWRQAKRHLRMFNGIPRSSFHLFLKECEWRFNTGPPRRLLADLKAIVSTDTNF